MASKKDRINHLKGVPLFEGLSQKDLETILSGGRDVHHSAGQTIISEGSTGGVGFHLILHGVVRVVRDGRTLAKLGPGQFFGEMAVIDDGPRSASVIADTDVDAFFISRWEFRPLLKGNPDLTWKLIQHRVGRVREEQSARAALIS